MSENGQYAGFWARVAASSLDMAIITLVALALGVAGATAGGIVAMVAGIVNLFFGLLYGPVMESSARQATIGKQMLGLQVTDIDGNRTSFLRALGRNLAKIISSIPMGIGFLMAAFTGKKQALHDIVASCLVVRTGPSQFLKAVLLATLGTAVVAGAGGAYVYYVLMPQMKSEVMGGLEGAMKPQTAPRPAAAPAPQAAAPKPAAPSAASSGAASSTGQALDFDKLAGAPLSGFDKPNTVRAGPAIVELSSFFNTSFWLRVNLPQIKDIDVGPPPEITVSKVIDSAGKDWYDTANTFEKDAFFRRARLNPELKPVPHFTGTRTVNIVRGLTEGNLQRIEGELRIFIPVEVKTEALQASDMGKERTVNTAAVTLKSINGADVVLHYRGIAGNLLGVRGVASGKTVDIASRQLPGSAGMVDMDMQIKFKAPVTIVEVAVAGGVAERSFPFVLTRGGTAGAAPVTVSSGKPQAQAPAAKPAAAATSAEDRMADKPRTAPALKPAASSGAQPQPIPAAKPAPEPQAKPAPPPRPQCVIKPVMTDAEIEICRQDRTPGLSSSGAAGTIASTAAEPIKPTAAAVPRAVTCVIKPVMNAQDMEACRRS